MENRIEKSLVIPKKDNVFVRIFKWIAGIANQEDEDLKELSNENNAEVIIPKAVEIPESSKPKKGSLEYLYNLSDKELDNLDQMYDGQIEEVKNELSKLEDILQSYKKTIKKFQEMV